MCGIFGVAGDLASSVSRKEVTAKSALLKHRGPDSCHVRESGRWIAGCRRLSINGPSSAARQPFGDADGLSIFFNGEIYDFREISGKASCDGEVLPRVLRECGPDISSAVDGVYAIAAFDRDEKLHLTRDFPGVKPLYYWVSPKEDGVIFSSELRFILSFEFVRTSPDKRALRSFLADGFVGGRLTGFEGVRKLLPGQVISFSLGRRWGARSKTAGESRLKGSAGAPPAGNLRGMLAREIGLQSRADVPVGIFLSGGLDSSFILFCASPGTGAAPPAFSLGFSEEPDGAREAADAAGADFFPTVVEPGDVFSREALLEAALHTEEPMADSAFIPTMFLADSARARGVKAVLVGEGADELFGGYRKYGIISAIGKAGPARFLSVSRRVPAALTGLAAPGYGRFAAQRLSSMAAAGSPAGAAREYSRIFGTPPAAAGARPKVSWGKAPHLEAMRYDIANSLPNNLLLKVDKATMARSVEARVPFLAPGVFSFFRRESARNPSLFLGKRILREAGKGVLPAAILRRRKAPFFPPFLDERYRRALSDLLDSFEFGPLRRFGIESGAIGRNLREAPIAGARQAYAAAHYLAWREVFFPG